MLHTQERILALVMAGGRGERLKPLTNYRSKPAVPFGGKYRIIDFVLSNLFNSGLKAIYVLTQYKAQSLFEHLQRGWYQSGGPDTFVTAVPAQMQKGNKWYNGTADAIYQNINLIKGFNPTLVVICGADHIYKMNIRQMIQFHQDCKADATIACLPVNLEDSRQYGIIGVDNNWRVVDFQEKPDTPQTIPGRDDQALASMGNYIFEPEFLISVLEEDARSDSVHDFGKSIFPRLYRHHAIFAYDFQQNKLPGVKVEWENAYWRDIGTIDAYYEANMDLKNVCPQLNLYNWDWPIHTVNFNDPPAKFVFDDHQRRGVALQSVVSGGCILAGGQVKDSILGRNVVVHSGALVTASILMDNVDIGRGARIHRAIIDKNCKIKAGEKIGSHHEEDARRFHVSPKGVVVIPKMHETQETRARNLI